MSEKLICANPKAFHDYFIEERYEAGIVLVGSEVKSLRLGKANLKDSHALIKEEEAYLLNLHITPYQKIDRFTPEPDRTRKLLLHKAEIEKLFGKMKEKGYSLIPLKLYFKDDKVKVELGLAKGKKLYDKRESIKSKEVSREMAKVMKEKNR
ncbi:MAG: SsrA-binding protein SmpB [Deltaproteobacteria bacterium]|nr:SsrA-binding protein SmpB [Deltaproteobacteria bacterium]